MTVETREICLRCGAEMEWRTGNLAVPEVPFQARLLRRRGGRLPRSRLEALDGAGFDPRSGELLVSLVWLVLGDLPIDEDELKPRGGARCSSSRPAATRTASSTSTPSPPSGSPRELDTPERREALGAALGSPRRADGLPTVAGALELLQAEPDLAWRSLALALLADELADE